MSSLPGGNSERADWLLKLRMGDYPLHLLNALHGKAGYIPDMMGVYRVHRGGTWRQMNWVAQVQANVAMFERMVEYARSYMDRSGVRLLWGTANLFSHPRYAAGAATNPDPEVFAYAAAQVSSGQGG